MEILLIHDSCIAGITDLPHLLWFVGVVVSLFARADLEP
jgi:hypothetical protein